MSDRKEIEQSLHEFVVAEFLDGDASDLTPTTNMLALGVLDSLTLVSLRTFVERTYKIRLPNDLTPEDFATISAMTSVVVRLREDQSP